TYIGDAYTNAFTDQLAEHGGLVGMSDSGELCKGLTDDFEVPTLSELHRQLFSLTWLFLETPTLNFPQLYPTGQLSRFILISGQALYQTLTL
ncbi:unnamed protein product, partial [Urochloa humidicola]